MHYLSVIRFVGKQASSDCGIAALAMYLGKTYEDVLTVAAMVTKNKTVHRSGVFATELVRIAQQMHMTLIQKRTWDIENAFGVLFVDMNKGNRHAVLLKDGLIYDPDDLTIWDAEVYFEQQDCKPQLLLTEKC
jgi:hypothetical protein